MKRTVLIMGTLLFLSVTVSHAQGGGNFQRRTVEERVKTIDEKFAAFNLEKSKATEVDSIFTKFFKDQDKLRDELMSSGGQRDQMREKMEPLRTERDDKLKKVLSDDQFKKWKDEIEPSMRQGRQGGGAGNSNP